MSSADDAARVIRARHPWTFRSGEWATLVDIVRVGPRQCYRVRFPDGAEDQRPIGDAMADYEIKGASEVA